MIETTTQEPHADGDLEMHVQNTPDESSARAVLLELPRWASLDVMVEGAFVGFGAVMQLSILVLVMELRLICFVVCLSEFLLLDGCFVWQRLWILLFVEGSLLGVLSADDGRWSCCCAVYRSSAGFESAAACSGYVSAKSSILTVPLFLDFRKFGC